MPYVAQIERENTYKRQMEGIREEKAGDRKLGRSKKYSNSSFKLYIKTES